MPSQPSAALSPPHAAPSSPAPAPAPASPSPAPSPSPAHSPASPPHAHRPSSPPPTPVAVPSRSSQSSSPPVKRRRAQIPSSSSRTCPRATQSPEKTAQADDEANNCIICLEPWANAGPHHVCCMPCGHLFGYKCIKGWLESQRPRQRSCPTCKTRGRVSELRYLFGLPRTLRAVDAVDAEALRRDLVNERASHVDTRAKLAAMKNLARLYRDALADARRSAPIPQMSAATPMSSSQALPHSTNQDTVSLLTERSTNGGTVAIACDAAAVLYAEFARRGSSAQHVCRFDLARASAVTHATHTFAMRVNAIDVCRTSETARCLAVSSADRRLTILSSEMQLACQLHLPSVPLSALWLSTPYHLAVGLLSGEIAVFDIRNTSGLPVHQSVIADTGWRAVHSLAELAAGSERVLLAAAPCGVYTVPVAQPNRATPLSIPYSKIHGASASDDIVVIAAKRPSPTLHVYNGITLSGDGDDDDGNSSQNTYSLGHKMGEALAGYYYESPFIHPVALRGESDTRGSMLLCPDTSSAYGVQTWAFRRDGMQGERWERQTMRDGEVGSGVRGVACATMPATARIVGLPAKVRGIFATAAEDSVRLFSAGRYR